MNEELRAALREQAEARQAYNALGLDAADADLAEARQRLAAADQAVVDALESAASAPRELRTQIRLGNYLTVAANEGELTGAEAELNKELRMAENVVPLEALLPLEERADSVSPQDASGSALASGGVNQTTGDLLRRVFSATDTAFLGTAMPMVPPGERVYPVMTDGTTAAMVARGSDGPDAGAAKFATINATPHRLTGRYVFDLEGVAELGGMLESTLRDDLRLVMGFQMDNQIINGTGKTGQVTGALAALAPSADIVANPYPALAGAATDPTQLTWETIRALATGQLDGKYARTEAAISMLIGRSTYQRGRNVYRDGATASNQDAIEALAALGVRVRQSFLLPAAAKLDLSSKTETKKEEFLLWSAELGSAIAPVWQGITVIRDPYTEAGKAQIILTAHMLFDFVIRRTDGWKLFGVNPLNEDAS